MKKIIALTSITLLTACGDSEQGLVVTKTCALDAPISNGQILAAQEINVMGWAFDNPDAGFQEEVSLIFNSSEQGKTQTFNAPFNVKRPDIATAFQNPKLENSGFSGLIPANTLAPGKYEITIVQKRSNAVVACGDGYVVEVK